MLDTRNFLREAVHAAAAEDPSAAIRLHLSGGRLAGFNVSADYGYPSSVWGSQLPRDWQAERMDAAYRNSESDPEGLLRVFTVWSYSTPIGWYDAARNEWVIPPIHYSVTTSRHQAYLRGTIMGAGYAMRTEPLIPANYRDHNGRPVEALVLRDSKGGVL